MARTGKPGMSNPEKEEVWKRWCRGESFSKIGRAVNKPPGSILHFFRSMEELGQRRKRGHTAPSASPDERKSLVVLRQIYHSGK